MPDSSLQSCLNNRWRVLVLLLFTALSVYAEDVASMPKPAGYVTDLAHVLTPSDQADLELFCVKVHEQLDAQFAIVTINTLNDRPIEDFTIDLFRKWGIGSKEKNDGLLILLVIKDHKQRVEVGRGLEQYLNDAFAGDTERDMRPLLRANNYGAALKQGALALATRLAQGENRGFSELPPVPQPQRQPQADRDEGIPWPVIIFFIVFFLIFIMSRRGGGGRGSSSGFWTGMIINSMLNSGRGGGGWGGGGGFGGGDSGGGGGFGGFGGGDSGGGGASSDW